MDHIMGDRVFGSLMRIARVKPVEEYWDLAVQRDEYARLFYEKVSGTHARVDCTHLLRVFRD